MRRIDALGITFGVFLVGGGLYWGLQLAGLEPLSAGIWSQVVLVGGLLGWLGSYLARVFTQKMTYNRQLQDYEDAVLQKRLDELSPEQLEALMAEMSAENAENAASEGSK
jgi:hypothetical protein